MPIKATDWSFYIPCSQEIILMVWVSLNGTISSESLFTVFSRLNIFDAFYASASRCILVLHLPYDMVLLLPGLLIASICDLQ